MQIVQETEYLLRLTRLGMINCFLLREDEGFTLIDTNLPGSASSILNAAKQSKGAIRTILLTHAHFDHVASLDALCAALPGVEICISAREAPILGGDLSLQKGESGRRLFGFVQAKSRATRLLQDGDRVGSLIVVSSPGHTPGHMTFFDTRDGTLIAGDAFMTQTGVTAAGTFKAYFPFAWLFSWNRELAAESARKLGNLNPARLAVGHGKTATNPQAEMDRAIDLAFRQIRKQQNL